MSKQSTNGYFGKIQKALAKAGLAEPVLLIDIARFDKNIDALKARLPADMAYRIVAKSLPCLPLLDRIMTRAQTNRLMSFNCEMTHQLFTAFPKADQLMGKPIPIAAVQGFFARLTTAQAKRAAQQIQWLVDTPTRLAEYEKHARRIKQNLRINLEIDVGLHRGGMAPNADLDTALAKLAKSKHLTLSGFMGYEPHLSKIPNLGGWRKRARKGATKLFAEALAQASLHFDADYLQKMTRNMAGSPTFRLYQNTQQANEIAAGSVLVKPSDFDLPILQEFQPAAFIATPALKVSSGIRLPALEFANAMLGKPQRGTTVFIHGGYWMANPVYPLGLKYSSVFGRSSNQEMLAGKAGLQLAVDEFVFLRPTQSEAVFLQFPKIAVYDGRQISDIWMPLPVSA